MNKTEKMREWLFPAILILFILQAMLLPVMIGITYAVPAERPEHILTYTPGKLVWEKDNIVRPDGSAELSFFETLYKNVNADKAQKVLAPGTGKDSVIRLKNDSNKEVGYTAILYSITTSPKLNISVSLSGEGFADATGYTLPAKIKQENVIRAVSGNLGAKKMQDFDIDWFWNYEEKGNVSERDRIDTYLGNRAAEGKADEATIGFYVVVNDNNSEIVAAPKTGDSMMGGYIVLMLISGGLCLFFGLTRREKNKDAD